MFASIKRLAARLRSTWTGAKPQHLEARIVDAASGSGHRLRIVADRHGATIDIDGAPAIVVDCSQGELRAYPVNAYGDVTEPAAITIPAGWTHIDTSVEA